MQALDVVAGGAQTVRLAGQRLGADAVQQAEELCLPTRPQVDNGQVHVDERPQLPLLRRLPDHRHTDPSRF